MKKYKVTVNGTAYMIELEAINDGAPAPAPAPAAAPAPAGGETVASPMPGTILSVAVKAGDAVKKGDLLVVLEAMKMENEILAPCDGTVASVAVSQGATVESGATLVVIG